MTTTLGGRTALVTGAGNGLGRAISLALSEAGASLILVGRDLEKLDGVVREVRDSGGAAQPLVVDVTDPVAVDAAIGSIDQEVSILVNNAGVAGPVAPLIDIEPEQWDAVFATNVRSIYLVSRAVLPGMIARGGGDIVNIASVAAKRPLAGRTPYGASKAAVLGLTTTLAAEVAPAGVMVNAVSPGPVEGPRMDRNFRLEADRRGISVAQAEEEYVSRAATKRMVTEAEVGRAVVAVVTTSGLCGIDLDLTAGMFAR